MIYLIGNGPMQTTSSFATVATGSAIKTLLQVKLTVPGYVVGWGCSFDGITAATPGKIELVQTGTIFGTVTASAAADISAIDPAARQFGDPTSTLISVGTSATGYTCSGEGSIISVINLDAPVQLPPTAPFDKQITPGQEAFIEAGKAMRIRVNFGTGVNAYAWVKIAF